MATLYTNFSIQESHAMEGRYYGAYNVLDGVSNEHCTGLVFMAYPSNDYRSTPLVFANKNPITLPTEVGGTVEGTLDAVEFEEQSEVE